MGGEVPTKYYSANKKSMIADDDVESLVIPARTKKTYEFDVRAVNSMIRYAGFLFHDCCWSIVFISIF